MIPVLIVGTIIAGGVLVYYMAQKPRSYPEYMPDFDSLTEDEQNAMWDNMYKQGRE